jgi:hypothetical protein
VALTTFDLVSQGSKRLFLGPDELRNHFRIRPDAKLVLLSIGKDNRVERFWRFYKSREFAEYLATLRVEHVTTPNFSFPLNVPRPEHLLNRMRTLRVAEEFSRVGMSVIPHLNAYSAADWRIWGDFLRDHSSIRLVALEFQTGLSHPEKAYWHVSKLREIQQSIGRGLHLIAIGARRHLQLLGGLSGVTVIDSVPFIRACKRRILNQSNNQWVVSRTNAGAPYEEILENNVSVYGRAVGDKVEVLEKRGAIHELLPRADDGLGLDNEGDSLGARSEFQLELWPENKPNDSVSNVQSLVESS